MCVCVCVCVCVCMYVCMYMCVCVCVCVQGRRYGFWAPGQQIHKGPSVLGGGGLPAGVRPEPVFFSPSPKSDYTVSAIKIVQFCM